MADVPHLVKNLQTAFVKCGKMLLSEDICRNNDLPSKIASIDHVINLVSYDSEDLKLALKLSKKTIDASN